MLAWRPLAIGCACVAWTSTARAEPPAAYTVPVAVLALDSEEAEEHADALTQALRSSVRASPGWSFLDSPLSLGMLTTALHCTPRPNAECRERIADHMKLERYVWGFVEKTDARHVTAEIHLYQRKKPEAVATEKYAENLKDAQDDALKQVAQRLLDKLAASAIGAIAVKAKEGDGEVVLDGDKKVPLSSGAARFDVSPGSHAVELWMQGQTPVKRTVSVAAGKETVVDLTGVALADPPSAEPRGPFPTAKVLGGVAMAAGVGLGILALERWSRWRTMQDELDSPEVQALLDTGGERRPACDARVQGSIDVCQTSKNAEGVSAVAIASAVSGAVLIGTGAFLLFRRERQPAATWSPLVGPGFGGATLRRSF